MAKLMIDPVKGTTLDNDQVTIDGIIPQKGQTPKLAGTLHSSDRGDSKAEWDIQGKCLGCRLMTHLDDLVIEGPLVRVVDAAMIVADDSPPPPRADGDVQEMQSAPSA